MAQHQIHFIPRLFIIHIKQQTQNNYTQENIQIVDILI